MNIQSPIIVVGPPRSGTSFVTECLMKYYGVRMCLNGFTTENDYIMDDRETYEDSTVVALNVALSDRRIIFEKYKEEMDKFFNAMFIEGGVWGFKDPRIYNTLDWIMEYFDGKLTVIRTIRDKDLVIDSMQRVLGWPKSKALEEYDEREIKINRALRYKEFNVIHCYFGEEKRTEIEFCIAFDKAIIQKQEREALALKFYKKKQERRSALSGS